MIVLDGFLQGQDIITNDQFVDVYPKGVSPYMLTDDGTPASTVETIRYYRHEAYIEDKDGRIPLPYLTTSEKELHPVLLIYRLFKTMDKVVAERDRHERERINLIKNGYQL